MNNKSSQYFLFKLIYLSLNVGLLEITETVSFPSCTLCLFQMLIIQKKKKTIFSYKSTSFVFLKLPTFCLRNWNCVSKWGRPKIRNQPFQRDKARVCFCYYDMEHDLSLFPLVVVAPCCCLLASCSLWAKAIASILSCSSCEVGAAWADEEAAAWVVTSLIEACNARAKASSSLKLPWSWLVLGLVRGCVGWDCCCLVKYLAIPCGGWFCLAKAALPASETCFVGLPVQYVPAHQQEAAPRFWNITNVARASSLAEHALRLRLRRVRNTDGFLLVRAARGRADQRDSGVTVRLVFERAGARGRRHL